jgi:hypothetical protein
MTAFAGQFEQLCELGIHCGDCRSLEAGRPWRQAIALAWSGVPAGSDFPCPRGMPWGFQPRPALRARPRPHPRRRVDPPAPLPGIFDVFACYRCHQARACPNASVCCGGQITINVVAPCPQGKILLKPEV